MIEYLHGMRIGWVVAEDVPKLLDLYREILLAH
jgi:hypothetical protein